MKKIELFSEFETWLFYFATGTYAGLLVAFLAILIVHAIL